MSSSRPLPHSPPPAFRSLTLKQRARWFRHQPTSSEALLWLHLRGKQLGVQFRRQVVIGNFIVDFFASSARLVVEVDGGYHEQRAAQDARRDARLRKLGLTVVRLPHELVVQQPLLAVGLVRTALASR